MQYAGIRQQEAERNRDDRREHHECTECDEYTRVGPQRGQRQHHHHVEDAVGGRRAGIHFTRQDREPRRQHHDDAPQAWSGDVVDAEHDDADADTHRH